MLQPSPNLLFKVLTGHVALAVTRIALVAALVAHVAVATEITISASGAGNQPSVSQRSTTKWGLFREDRCKISDSMAAVASSSVKGLGGWPETVWDELALVSDPLTWNDMQKFAGAVCKREGVDFVCTSADVARSPWRSSMDLSGEEKLL